MTFYVDHYWPHPLWICVGVVTPVMLKQQIHLMMLLWPSALRVYLSTCLKGPLPIRTLYQLQLRRPRLTSIADSALLTSEKLLIPTSLIAIRGISTSVRRDSDVTEPPLPKYVPRKGESVEVKRARLLYQSRYPISLASAFNTLLPYLWWSTGVCHNVKAQREFNRYLKCFMKD